ncbi:MAG: hypothetical protein H6620_11560 [Halobacteriovoraceae bacterium]|nr:hypothetical protein [Halobacteriovoraceae bacterium]
MRGRTLTIYNIFLWCLFFAGYVFFRLKTQGEGEYSLLSIRDFFFERPIWGLCALLTFISLFFVSRWSVLFFTSFVVLGFVELSSLYSNFEISLFGFADFFVFSVSLLVLILLKRELEEDYYNTQYIKDSIPVISISTNTFTGNLVRIGNYCVQVESVEKIPFRRTKAKIKFYGRTYSLGLIPRRKLKKVCLFSVEKSNEGDLFFQKARKHGIYLS